MKNSLNRSDPPLEVAVVVDTFAEADLDHGLSNGRSPMVGCFPKWKIKKQMMIPSGKLT